MPVTDVIALPAATVKTLYESNANTNAFTDADSTKLGGIEANATADQTGAEIVSAIDAQLGNSDWQTPGGGGSSYTFYDLGNNAYVFATGAGVTFAKNATTGELTYTVPDGVLISGGGVLIAASDADGSNDAFLQLNFGGTRTFNQGVSTAWRPLVEAHNGQASPSRGAPSFKSNTMQTAITAVGSNDIEVLLDDIGNLFANILVTFTMP